jgi:3-oxoacyl-(acyl-carrier-protein) synthase
MRFTYTATNMLPNMPGSDRHHVWRQRHQLRLVSACATGSHALGEAFEIIRRGDAQAMLVGGVESGILLPGGGLHRTGAMSTQR